MSTKIVSYQSEMAKTVFLGPNQVTFLLSGEQTGGRYSLTEFAAAPPPALAAPIHIHHDADEAVYILEGDFQFTVNDQTIPASAGSYILVPKGTPHTVANIGPSIGRMLVILTPPGFEKFWEERARQMAEFGHQIDPELARALQEKYYMDTGGQVRQFTKP